MFSLISILLVLGTSNVSANELDVDCEAPLNQSEILYCTTRNYERSEEMMVNLYKSISSKSDKLGKQYLMDGQVSFESFRKLSCQWEGDQKRTQKTLAQTIEMECKLRLTTRRIEEFQKWLKNL
jgi:uncharacterized protein YecT (DUF1311 family)